MTIELTAPARPVAPVWLSGYRAARTRFPPRPAAAGWPSAAQAREQVRERLASAPPGSAGGLGLLLDWLEDQPGDTWQQRWLASGAETAGTSWRQLHARCEIAGPSAGRQGQGQAPR